MKKKNTKYSEKNSKEEIPITKKTKIQNEESVTKISDNKKSKNVINIDEILRKIKNLIFQKILKKDGKDKKVKNLSKIKYVEEIIDLTTPIVSKIIFKRIGSKGVQACLKFGNNEQRNKIFKLVIEDLSELIKSKYGHFIILKLLKNFNKVANEKIFHTIMSNLKLLISHPVNILL